jgi:hypothetical protein
VRPGASARCAARHAVHRRPLRVTPQVFY